MRHLFSLIFILFICTNICAQTMQETVYLKNGSITKGVVLELNLGDSVKLQTADGSIFVFQMKDVDKITKEVQEQPISNVRRDFDIEPKGFIYTVDGNMYYTEGMNLRSDHISAQHGDSQLMIPLSDIVLFEALEVNGIVYLQKDKIKKVNPTNYDGNLSTFVLQGKKVYIPICSPSVEEHWASKRLRELLLIDGYWKVVGCEEEADFILKYKFEDKGPDHSYLMIFDRMGQEVARSSNVGASYLWPTRVGDKTAESLYKKRIKNRLEKGKTSGWH